MSAVAGAAIYVALIVLICRAIPPRENNSAILGTASGELFPAFVADDRSPFHSTTDSPSEQHDHA